MLDSGPGRIFLGLYGIQLALLLATPPLFTMHEHDIETVRTPLPGRHAGAQTSLRGA